MKTRDPFYEPPTPSAIEENPKVCLSYHKTFSLLVELEKMTKQSIT